MPVKVRTLKVRANPWVGHDTINNLGLPVGRVLVEQPPGGFDHRHVGVSSIRAIKTSEAPKDAPLAQESHELVVEYDDEATVPNTDYYRRRVMRGDLIATNRESFVAAGGKPKDYEEHQKHLELQKAAAIAEFDDRNGAGAFAALNAQHVADEARRADVLKAVAAARGDVPAPVEVAPKKPSSEAKKADSQ